MKEQSPTMAALSRAARRASIHLIQALVEGLKAVEAIIEEIGGIADQSNHHDDGKSHTQRIEIE